MERSHATVLVGKRGVQDLVLLVIYRISLRSDAQTSDADL